MPTGFFKSPDKQSLNTKKTLSNDRLRYDLAKTTVSRGVLNREFVTTKIKKSRKAFEATTKGSSSDIHFKAMMGSKFNTYKTPEKKIEAFDKIYTQSAAVMNDTHRSQFAKMLEEEKYHPGQYVFYNGANAEIAFLNDVVTEIRRQVEHQYSEDFLALRAFDDIFTEYKDVTAFAVGNYDRNNRYSAFGLAVNPFLFGSDGKESEATYRYFMNNRVNWSEKSLNLTELLGPFLKRLNIDIDFLQLEKLYTQFSEKAGGVCYQIFIDDSCVDQVAKSAGENGHVVPLQTDEGLIHDFSKIMETLKANPIKYAHYIENMQARLYLNPKFFHDPDKIQIKTYRSDPLSLLEEKIYKAELAKIVSSSLVSRLETNQKLPSTAFTHSNGNPSLQRQMNYVYQDHQLKTSEIQDITLIPDLIAQGDVSSLVKIMVNTKKLDLRMTIYDYPIVGRPSFLALFERHPLVGQQVFSALQQHKDKEHIAQVLWQLQPIALNYYVCTGKIDEVKTLLYAEINRDPRYLNDGEKWFLEYDPNRYPRLLLKHALLLATEYNQVEVLKWLEERYSELEGESLPTTSWRDILNIAIEKGNLGIIELALAHIEEKYISAQAFNHLLSLARQHNQTNAIGIILKKLKKAPKNVFDLVLFQENSIIFYLTNNQHEDVLKELNVTADEVRSNIKVLIPKLLEKGDVAALVETLLYAADLDLTQKLISSKDSQEKELLSFFGKHLDVTEQVFMKLQQYSYKEPIAKALQQLQRYAWYQAIRAGNVQQAKEYFKPEYLDSHTFILAVQYNQVETADWLLSLDGTEKILRSHYETLCRNLIEKGQDLLLQKIIEKQPWFSEKLNENIFGFGVGNNYLLTIAVKYHHANMIPIIFSAATPEQLSSTRWLIPNLLTRAVKHNDIAVAKILLNYLDFNRLTNDQYGKTSIMIAAELGYTEMVILLLSQSAICENRNYLATKVNGLDALSLAAKNGHIDIMKILLTNPSIDFQQTFNLESALKALYTWENTINKEVREIKDFLIDHIKLQYKNNPELQNAFEQRKNLSHIIEDIITQLSQSENDSKILLPKVKELYENLCNLPFTSSGKEIEIIKETVEAICSSYPDETSRVQLGCI